MTVLSAAAVLALAASCQSTVAPETILKLALKESGLNTAAVHMNTNGSVDKGLMQINSANYAFLGLRDPFDPCQSIRAAADLLASFSRYNSGSPIRSLDYAMSVQAIRVAEGAPASPPPDHLPTSIFAHPTPGRELVFSH